MASENGEPEVRIVSSNDEVVAGVLEALRGVYDAEIPINIYDLGLVYKLEVETGGYVTVHMSLTSPGSHLSYFMPLRVKSALKEVDGVAGCDVELVFEPPWVTERVSPSVRRELHIPLSE